MAYQLLVHAAFPEPSARGLTPLSSELPDGWGPEPKDLDCEAFATPFGRAEAMTRVLAAFSLPDGAKTAATAGTYFSLSRRWFEALLVGVVSGVLDVEMFDLEDKRFDNFGATLRKAEDADEYRYLARVFDPQTSETFGYGNPRCLFWPHARRTEEQLATLENRLQSLKADATRLLAEFRSCLVRAKLWAPERIPWQSGVNAVVGGQASDAELTYLREHTRSCGPVVLALPRPLAEGTLHVPIYFPTFEKDYSIWFLERTASRVVSATSGPRRVELQTQQGTFGTIRLPEPAAGGSVVKLGAGVMSRPSDASGAFVPMTSGPRCYESTTPSESLPGKLEEVTNELRSLLAALPDATPKSHPFLYPDPYRILFERNLWRDVGVGTVPIRCTTYAEGVALKVGGPGRLPDPPASEVSDGAVVATFQSPLGPVRMLFVEKLDRNVDVGDLRALGLALFEVFVGDATIAPRGIVLDAEGRPLTRSDELRPWQPESFVYERVRQSGKQLYGDRLASLQRFVLTYREERDLARANASPIVSIPILLYAAAQHFARWAYEGDVVPMGQIGSSTTSLELSTGERVPLAVDKLRGNVGGRS